MLKVINVVGARPNFMKIAPLHKEMVSSLKIKPILVHTGQHYDQKMSKIFFDDLGLPKPDFYLGVGSASHAQQTAKIMVEFEKILLEISPDLVLVVGDVNSTLACSLVASKLNISVAHVESGLRSFDRNMPEEINRIITDAISDHLFVSEKSGLINLQNEGVEKDKVHFVGNVMIDSLIQNLEKCEDSDIIEQLKLDKANYGVLTLHRPSNVDNEESLSQILNAIDYIQKQIPIVFSVHPRTLSNISKMGFQILIDNMKNLKLIGPASYLDFMKLMKYSKIIITDSGGIQEESTYLKIPCLTLRENTERPVTIDVGTNQLVDISAIEITKAYENLFSNSNDNKIPELWDGLASKRIVEIIEKKIN